MASANEIKNQLHMVHDPFANTTTQPKIPDGKVNASLGFQTQLVKEIGNATGEDTLHMLMFAGTNSAIVIEGATQANPPALGTDVGGRRPYFIPGFEGSNQVGWSTSVEGGDYTEAIIKNEDRYALWRVVSCGAQFKLLNPTEQDDGWWEAIRINTDLNPEDYLLTTTDNNDTVQEAGTIAPAKLMTTFLKARNLVNEHSYTTGLLRDLHRVQFELHGRMDYHDFVQKREVMRLDGDQIRPRNHASPNLQFDTDRVERGLVAGEDDVMAVINNWIDPSYDMLYLRFHCRKNTGTAGDGFEGSRFHTNVISNQEIFFDSSQRESRFQTNSYNIGAGSASVHLGARQTAASAAQYIT